MVAPEMRGTLPRWTIVRASSVTDQRESGLPEFRGRVQANAVTCARTAEGEKAWTTGPGRVLEGRPRPTPPPPFADRPIRAAHGSGDCGIAPLRVLVGKSRILARTTSACGAVRRRARRWSSRYSGAVRATFHRGLGPRRPPRLRLGARIGPRIAQSYP